MTRLFKIVAGLTLVLFAACGGGANKGYTLPADNPMKEFSPPDADELVEDEDMMDDLDDEEEAEKQAMESGEPSEGAAAKATGEAPALPKN